MATAYGLKFYKTVQGVNVADGNRYPVTLKIYEKDYNGFSSEIEALGADSIRISYGNQGDRRYEPIKKTSIGFSIVDTEQFDYSQFYTSDATKYKVEVDALGFKHVGFIVQDSFSRNLSYRALINLTAIDNLSILDNIESKSLTFTKYEKIGSIVSKIIAKCYPDASVAWRSNNQYYGGSPLSGSLISKYEDLLINTDSFADKNLKEVLEDILLSGMLYIFQSGTGYIIREYTSDYSTNKLLQRKVAAQFEGESELSMTPAVRKFKLEQGLEEAETFSGYNPTKNDDYEFVQAGASDYFPYYKLKKWKNVRGYSWRNIQGRETQIYSDGLPIFWRPDTIDGVLQELTLSGYDAFLFRTSGNAMGDFNAYSIAEIGLMPSDFSVVFTVNPRIQTWPDGENQSEVTPVYLKEAIYKYGIKYTENGIDYYFDRNTGRFGTDFKTNTITVNNPKQEMRIKVDVPFSYLGTAKKVFSFLLFPVFSSNMNDYPVSFPVTTKIKSIEIIPSSTLQRYDGQKVNITVGENNLDSSEEVFYSASPNPPLESMLYYNNILLNSVGENMLTTQFININPDLGIGDMKVLEYQARACLFLTEAPAKKVNGGVFMNTNDMVADYMTTETDSYLSSGTDQIVLADTKSSKGITRVDTLFDFILATKFGDYRINQAEINLLRFAIDGEFCEVKEFYISDYIANQPIINTFIQRNYLKHS